MERRQRIVLYGKTLIMDTIGRSLRPLSGSEIICLEKSQQMDLEKTSPDIIFFDLEADHPKSAFSMLDRRPDMLLIGVSPDINAVKIWTAKELQKLSTQDLLDMVNEQSKNRITV